MGGPSGPDWKWAFMEAYIKAFKGLFAAAEIVEWEGLAHSDASPPRGTRRAQAGRGAGDHRRRWATKGGAIAKEYADGLIAVAGVPDFAKEFSWVATYLCFGGTVLERQRARTQQTDRVRDAAGPAHDHHVPRHL